VGGPLASSVMWNPVLLECHGVLSFTSDQAVAGG